MQDSSGKCETRSTKLWSIFLPSRASRHRICIFLTLFPSGEKPASTELYVGLGALEMAARFGAGRGKSEVREGQVAG